MKFEIASYPSSYLVVEMEKDEQLITEKGTMIYCDGEYQFENKIEAKSYKNWIAALFGGKSFMYSIYTAKERLKIALSAKGTAELFYLNISADNPILIEPDMHFARTAGLEIELCNRDWKSTLNDGLKLKTKGSGTLFLKGHGKIIEQNIYTQKPILVDEEALIAFEESLEVTSVSKGLKETLTSGEGFLFEIRGKGKIWLQTRNESLPNNGGGLVKGIFDFMT